jgi:hypothetical protein
VSSVSAGRELVLGHRCNTRPRFCDYLIECLEPLFGVSVTETQ